MIYRTKLEKEHYFNEIMSTYQKTTGSAIPPPPKQQRKVMSLQDHAAYAILSDYPRNQHYLGDKYVQHRMKLMYGETEQQILTHFLPAKVGWSMEFQLHKWYTPADLNCDYLQLKYDTLFELEFTPDWFKYVQRFIPEFEFGFALYNRLKIPVTWHFYNYMVKKGYIVHLMSAGHSDDTLRRHLEQCGDIESNPGPSYKDQCRQKYKRKEFGNEIQEQKEHQKFLKEIEREATMQVFGIDSALTAIGQAYVGKKTASAMDSIKKNADTLTSELIDLFDYFKSSLSTFKNIVFKGINCLDIVIETFFSLIQISLASPGKKLLSMGVEIARLVKHFGLSCTVSDLKNFVFGKFNAENKFNRNVTMQSGSAGNIANYVIKLLFAIMGIAFVGFIPDPTHMEKTLKRMGDFSRNCKSMSDFNKEFHGALTGMIESFQTNVLGLEKEEEITKFVSGMDEWFLKTRALLIRTDEIKKSDTILNDTKTILEVEELYRQGLEFSKDIADKKLHRDLLLPFQMHMKLLADLVKMVDTSGAFGTKPRTQPVVIWLFGESGVGKSGMSWPLAIDLNNIFMTNKEDARNFSRNIYMRNVEQEFWDNYQGQNVVIYDDFGQRKDSQAKPNEEFMELIRTANIAPYPLHMAHLEDKRKTKFTSKILLMTSNVFEQSVDSLTFPDAFRRRIDLCGRVSNKPQYTKPGFSKATGQTVKRLDKDRVRKEFNQVISTDVYLIDLIDAETGDVIEEGLDYAEFLERATQKTNEAFNQSVELNEFLENYAESRYRLATMQIGDEFHDCNNLLLIKIENFDDLPSSTLLFDSQGNSKSKREIEESLQNAWLAMEEDTSMWHDSYYNFRDDIVYKKYKRSVSDREFSLMKAYEYFKKQSSKFLNDTLTYIREHPFKAVAGVMIAVFTLMTIGNFWTSFWSKPERDRTTKMTGRQQGNIVELPYRGEEAIDLRHLEDKQLIDYLHHFTSSALAGSTYAFIFNQPNAVAYGILTGAVETAIVYIYDKFRQHGKTVTPEVEAATSGDCMTRAKPRVILEATTSGDAQTQYRSKPKIEAFTSADVITITKPKVMVEAVSSGDSVTQNKPKAKIEAVTSGDSQTMVKPKVKIEAQTSGDNITVVRPKILTEGDIIPANMQMWKDQVAQNLITHRIFNNLYKISANNCSVPLMHGLMVKGRIMLIPAHILGCGIKADTEITMENMFKVKFTFPFKSVKVTRITNRHGESKEACLFGLPNLVHTHCDITKHFSDSEAMSSYSRAEVNLPLLRYSQHLDSFIVHILSANDAFAIDHPIILNDVDLGKHVVRRALEYTAPTTNGDCGAPLIINEPSVLRKIAGIHVAGDAHGRAYSESITQADLTRAYPEFPARMQICLDWDNKMKFHPIEIKQEYTKADFPYAPGDMFGPIGKCPHQLFEPGKTDIRPSVIHGRVRPPITKPAILRHPEVNMKFKNLQKCASNVPYINEDWLEEAYLDVKQLWNSKRNDAFRRILTDEEVIKGNDISEYISSINRQSSPGYPWILDRKPGFPGKTQWFGNDEEYKIDPDVMQKVHERIENAKQGIRTPTFWVDTLKDERRPIEKVDALKTRVFSNGPMDFNLAFRKYFLGFIAHLMENRIDNEVAIGTNVYSRDWTKLAKKLKQKGKNVFAGDFSNFDGSLNAMIMYLFARMANEFYDDGNDLIRYVLIEEILNSVHLCEQFFYMMTHSQPSGNPATTPLNCLINSIGLRLCFLRCFEEHKAFFMELMKKFGCKTRMELFRLLVSLISYGDDNVINIHPLISHLFNMNSITKYFAEFGFTYTDETKQIGKGVPDYKTLEEISFLKRGFIFNEERNCYDAPLDINTILEMINWVRKDLDQVESTKINCENAIMELAMHPRAVFDKWTPQIEKAFYDKTGVVLNHNSYDGYWHLRNMEYFL